MNELQVELRKQIRRFCEEQIHPHLEEDEKNSKFRMEIFQGLGSLGVTGITTPEEFEGAGLTYQDLCHTLEELGGASASYAVTLSVSSMVQAILCEFASLEQKKIFLPALARGEEIGAFALSESHSGSDAANLKTTAKKVQGGYILNGSKMWITSGGIAKTYIVMARTSHEGSRGISAFILRDGDAGFEYGKCEDKMGWKVSPTRELIFSNCFVSEDRLLSTEGMGFKIAMRALDRGRITIGALAVGLSQKALDIATSYALEREQFSQPIFNFQGLQFMLADMATELEASRLLVYKAAQEFDAGISNQKLASMAKLKATDSAMKITTDAVQVLGGVGYTKEYPAERLMRDAKVLQIVEGTNQIQKVVIARQLKKEYS